MEYAARPIQQATEDLATVVNGTDDVKKQVSLFRRAGEILSAHRGRVPPADAVHLASLLVDIHGRALEQELKEQQSNGCFVVSTMSPAEAAANSTFEYDSIPMIRAALERNDWAVNRHLIKKIVNYGVANDKPEESPLTQLLVDIVHRQRNAAEWALDSLAGKGGEAAGWLKATIVAALKEHKGNSVAEAETDSTNAATRHTRHPHSLLALRQ